jgi:hypothetical protein
MANNESEVVNNESEGSAALTRINKLVGEGLQDPNGENGADARTDATWRKFFEPTMPIQGNK